MMKVKYYWNGIIRLILESYWDLCVGILLSFKEPRYDKLSDIFDFCLTVFFALFVIAGPIASFFTLQKNANQLDKE